MGDERNPFLDFSKGALITLVVIGHSIQFIAYQGADGFWSNPVFKAIYMFHMPLFMALSGYLTNRGVSTSQDLPRYVGRRVLACIVPVVGWATILKASLFVFGAGPVHITDLPVTILSYSVNSMWYLWALAASVCLAAVARLFGVYRNSALLALVVVVMGLPAIGPAMMFQYTFPFFAIGLVLADAPPISNLSPNAQTALSSWLLIASLVCFFFWKMDTYVYITGMRFTDGNVINILFRWLAGAIVSAFAMVTMYHLYSRLPTRIADTVSAIGQKSIYVYVLQDFAFALLVKVSAHSGSYFASGIVSTTLSIAFAICLTYVLWRLGNMLATSSASAWLLFGARKLA